MWERKKENTPIIRVRNLCVRDKFSGKPLIENINFEIRKGECLGIVGESGSGKSMSCRAVMGLLPIGLKAEGEAWFENFNMLAASKTQAQKIRGCGISAILQHPMTAFDPLYTMGAQIAETLGEKLNMGKKEAKTETYAILEKVNLARDVANKYPFQLSGGMLQRCMIALSLALGSKVVVADEPTTALDAQNQFEVLQRLARLRKKYSTTLIFVSHDLGAVQALADHIMVLHDGHCVEYGHAEDVLNNPQSSYTQYLVESRMTLTRAYKKFLGELHAAN